MVNSVFAGGANKTFNLKTGVLGNVSNPRIPQPSVTDSVLPSPGLAGDNCVFDYQHVSTTESCFS